MSGEDYSHVQEFPGIRYENGYAVLYLLDNAVSEIGRYGPRLVSEREKQPVIDFSLVDFVNSKTAAAVFDLWKEIISSPNPRTLTLRGLKEEKLKAFVITGFIEPDGGSILENLVIEKAVDLKRT